MAQEQTDNTKWIAILIAILSFVSGYGGSQLTSGKEDGEVRAKLEMLLDAYKTHDKETKEEVAAMQMHLYQLDSRVLTLENLLRSHREGK